MKKLYKKLNHPEIKYLHDKNKPNSDEYYTTEELVTDILDNLSAGILKDKIVYLPCDSEESQFTIQLQKRKDEFQYKELIYTSDDFRTHEDIFDKADFIITNPPFSIFAEFIRTIYKHNCKFAIIGHQTGQQTFLINNIPVYSIWHKVKNKFIPGEGARQWKPWNNTTNIVFYSSSDITKLDKTRLRTIRYFKDVEDQLEWLDNTYNDSSVLNVNYIYDLPVDYDGYFALPVTSMSSVCKYVNNIEPIYVIQNPKVNGKSTFIRILCKWKDFEENWNLISS